MGKWKTPETAPPPGRYCFNGKRRYGSEAIAKAALPALRQFTTQVGRPVPKRAYQCPECWDWHITHQTPAQRDQIAEKRHARESGHSPKTDQMHED